MSDFDPKNIPTLDDIIKDETIDETPPDLVENEDSLDLIADEKTEIPLDTDTATETPNDSLDKKDSNDEASPHLSPYIFEETYDDSAYRLTDEIPYEDQITYDDPVDFNPVTPLPAPELDTIVKSVVKQLMPDLEQQLRFLIQQALEEQLPPELIQSPDNVTDDS